jgi:hypothetical protein
MRQRIGRLARETVCYSRCVEMHDAVIKLWVLAHNQRRAKNSIIQCIFINHNFFLIHSATAFASKHGTALPI